VGFEMIASGPEASEARETMTSALKLYYAAVMQGVARAATAYALGYTQQRRQTGRAIVFHQNVYKKLVEMEVSNQSMASFLYRAACNDAAEGFGLRDMLYAFVKSSSEHVVSEAMQSLGGYGYIREYGIEKRLRDIKTLQALLPTSLTDWVGARV
jgi:alkylation response protein AidB-like acyl-CoA dehydrogenase